MCGIAGVISFVEDMREEIKSCEAMQKALMRRGPDQNGIMLSREASLVHTRLAVIDIHGGRQPMTCSIDDRNYTIVYNGELYNTDEIRKELISDFEFDTRSDTEVVLKSYVKWGNECVKKFNGIFAFAVYDEYNHCVFLARDRIGVKPLFYYQTKNKLIFASEIPALLQHPEIPHEIDEKGVSEILLIAPGRTAGYGVIKDIRELKSGQYAYYSKKGLEIREYWRLHAYELHESFEQTAEHTRELVLDSIKRQLVSDVPICTFLSGGLDSSLISSVASRELKKQGKHLDTFSVDYLDNDKYFQKSHFQPNSDNEYINIMTDYLKTNHHWKVIDTPELVNALYEAVDARGLPGMADVDASMLILCREIKKFGTVALSGECADELFGGYPWYRDKDIRETDGFPWAQSTFYRKRFISQQYKDKINPEEYVYSRYRETVDYAEKLSSDSPLEYRMREMTQLNFNWFMQTLLDNKDIKVNQEFICLYSLPHTSIASSMGRIVSPSSLREYSTLGGTSAYTVRIIIPSDSIERRFSVSTFWLIPSRDLCSSLNLQGRTSRFLIIRSFHLLPIICTVVATSQSGSSFFLIIVLPPIIKKYITIIIAHYIKSFKYLIN